MDGLQQGGVGGGLGDMVGGLKKTTRHLPHYICAVFLELY